MLSRREMTIGAASSSLVLSVVSHQGGRGAEDYDIIFPSVFSEVGLK